MQILGRDILITLIVISTIVYINSQLKNKKRTSLYNAGIILLSVVMVIIFSLTGVSPISGFNIEIRIDEISFIPFRGIIEMLQGGLTLHTFVNILGNIIMFMPMGFLLPLLFSNLYSLKKTVAVGFGTSLLIEFTQLFLIRATDIDDLILNTLGTMLGYLVFLTFKKLLSRLTGKFSIESIGIENKLMLWSCILVPYMVIIMAGFYDRYILL